MLDGKFCAICNCTFRSSDPKANKCVTCAKEHPKENSMLEIIDKNKPNKEITLTEEKIRSIIYEVLEDAGIKRIECEKCNNLYFQRSPAQKNCSACKK